MNYYPHSLEFARSIEKKVEKFLVINEESLFLEIGAAQGTLCIALTELGYKCLGIEPCENAVEVSKALAKKLNASIEIKKGFAESIPIESNSVDIVIAISVLEHVRDLNAVIKEVSRVLKPKGAFYFVTASSICPVQGEIMYFPFFSWYPRRLKVKIMNWAVENRPSLIGYTTAPAINWFTPWGTRKLLKTFGFSAVYDYWDLADDTSYSFLKKKLVTIVRSGRFTKFLADLFEPFCCYLAVKNVNPDNGLVSEHKILKEKS